MQNRNKIYTVSQVNALIKGILENNLPPRLTITGEITDWKLHHSGHCYFSLKDENSTLPCAMWKSNSAKLKFQPENGLAVLGTGFIDVYVPYGRYQFIIDGLVPAGVGTLQLAFEQMVKRLRAQGLFDEAHKKTIPKFPERIGILTSESGAAIGDIKDSIRNRWPCTKLFLYPVPVQGEGAAEQIAAALRNINRRNKELKLDILIVGRGGGSLEDLWAFNEEILARAIFDSQIPVISAVGHEIDTTIADLVADARASTPTKAGVVAVPDMHEVLGRLSYFERRLAVELKSNVEICQGRLETILASWVFRNPMSVVFYAEERLDEVEAELLEVVRKLLDRVREKITACGQKVLRIEPHRILGRNTVNLNNLKNQASTAVNAIVNKNRIQLTAAASRLTALNPKSVLQRGYSITTNKKTGLLIKTPEDVKVGDLIITELAPPATPAGYEQKNLIESKVTKK